MPFGKVIIHSLRRRSGVDVWMCGRACAHASVECVGMCVCSSEPGGSEGGVKCYSFSSFHVTEKCLCQTLQRREKVFGEGLISGGKRENEERSRHETRAGKG